jgi:FAD/FMN-containing dehydrogenase
MTPPAAPPDFRGRFLADPRVRAAYSEGAGPYRIIPAAVAFPEHRDDLCALVKYAVAAGIALTPRGAGSGMPGGNVGAGIVVDMRAFDRPLRIALDKIGNIGAAAPWAAVNQAAAHFGFRLPPDPASGAFCTIGGMVSTNAAGAHSYSAGSIRRWVRGMELISMDGEAGWISRRHAERKHRLPTPPAKRVLVERYTMQDRIDALLPRITAAKDEITARFPKTRKNSAGYALDAFLESGEVVDLLVGSEGTLGIISRVELQLDKTSPATGTLLVGLASLDTLGDVVTELTGHEPAAIELLDRSFLDLVGASVSAVPLDGVAALLIVDFERASDRELRAVLATAQRTLQPSARYTRMGVSAAERERLWKIRHGASPALAALPAERRSLQVIEDGCVPVAALGPYLAGLRDAARAADIPLVAFGHAGDGHLHVNALVDTTQPDFETRLEQLLATVTRLVIGLGGTPSGEHGVGRLRAQSLEQLYGPVVTALFRDIKRTFDPTGVLNPGIIIPDGTPPLAALKVGPRAQEIPAEIAEQLRRREMTAGWGAPVLGMVDEHHG